MHKKKKLERIVLGSAQFGLPYGISNENGKTKEEEVFLILNEAVKLGITCLDTSPSYGNSEEVLGKVGLKDWSIVSKLPSIPKLEDDIRDWIFRSVVCSLEKLKVPFLQGLMMHKPLELLGANGERIYDSLLELKTEGLVKELGISVYSPEEMILITTNYQFDSIQAPFNILDRRILDSDKLKLKKEKLKTYVRSVFLQGLLLMSKEKRPSYFHNWDPILDKWLEWLKKEDQSPVASCINFALLQPDIDYVVVGVNNLLHFREIIHCVECDCKIPPNFLLRQDLNLINPTRWKTHE